MKMSRKIVLLKRPLCWMLALALTLAASVRAAEPAYQGYVVSLSPAYIIPPGESPERGSVSPDGKHLAVWISVGERGYIWYDGNRSRLWDAMLLPKFSPDSRHVAYIALEATGTDNYLSYVVYDTTVYGPFSYLAFDKFGTDELVFSPDGAHFAFRAWGGGQATVYLDGQKSSPYLNVTGSPPLFDAGGKRFAYLALDSAGGYVVLDGHPGPKFAQVTDMAGFSDEGSSFSYLGYNPDGTIEVIKDSSKWGPFRRVTVAGYRPGTRELYFSALREETGRESLYVDQRAVADHEEFGELAFSDDGQHSGYTVREEDWNAAIIDSVDYRHAGSISSLFFAPHGAHFTYRTVALLDSATSVESVYVDSSVFGPFARTTPVIFSPDGVKFIFVGVDSAAHFSVIAGDTTYGPFDSAAVVGWSSDSRQFAFTTVENGMARMYIDGRAQQPYRHVMRQVWFDTTLHTGIYVGDPEAKGICLVANDSSLVPMDFFYGSALTFTADGTLRGYGQRGDTIMQYVIRRAK